MDNTGKGKEQARQAAYPVAIRCTGNDIGQQQYYAPYHYMQRDRNFFQGDIFFHLLSG